MIQRSDFKDVADTAPIVETDRFSKEYWTIGQMAGHFDVSLRTLRFYEDRGLISPLRHGATRFYGAECRRTLDRVLRAKKLGFTLTRIQRLLLNNAEAGIAESLAPGEIVAQLSVLERQKANLDQAIMDLRAAHAQIGGQGQPMARAG